MSVTDLSRSGKDSMHDCIKGGSHKDKNMFSNNA